MTIDHVLSIWDFGGQDRFQFILPTYMKGTNLLLYIIDPCSLNISIGYIKNEGYNLKRSLQPIPELYIKTKCDLIGFDEEKDSAQIDGEIASAFPGKEIIPVSSKTGQGFDTLISIIKNVLSMYHDVQNCTGDKTITSKVAIAGAGGVGKTTLIDRLITGRFNADTTLTVGVSYKVHRLTQETEKKE